MKMKNNAGLEFEIISLLGNKQCIVKFTETGYTRQADINNVRAGKVRDHYAKSVYGRGYNGNHDNKKPYWKKARQLWTNMMKRCYSDKDTRGYLFKSQAVVDERWHCFANFLDDISELPNFDKWLAGGDCTQTRYTLDKDVLCGDHKVYSKHTCQFISEHENKRLGAIQARKTDPRYYKPEQCVTSTVEHNVSRYSCRRIQ